MELTHCDKLIHFIALQKIRLKDQEVIVTIQKWGQKQENSTRGLVPRYIHNKT